MDTLFSNHATLWLCIGFILLAIELLVFGFASGVLLFGSLGALLTGGLLWFELIPNNFLSGIASFAVCTALITALLWIPLRKMQSGSELGNDRSSDLIGHTFTLSSSITRTDHGSQKYSGMSWRVEPDKELKAPAIDAGTEVTVSAVSAGVFFVKPVTA